MSNTNKYSVREKVVAITKQAGTIISHTKSSRNLTEELAPLNLNIRVSNTTSNFMMVDLYSNDQYLRLLTFPKSGAGSIDITLKNKEYQVNLFSESRVCKDTPEMDLIISLSARDSVRNVIEAEEYTIHTYKYRDPTNNGIITKGAGEAKPSPYNLETDYKLVGTINPYQLWRKNKSTECLWVETGTVNKYYPMKSIQSAVEFFCLCQANRKLKLNIDQAKEKLGIKQPFYQDFTRIEYEEDVNKKAKLITDDKSDDFNNKMARLAMFAIMKMDEYMRKPVLEKLSKYIEAKNAPA